LQTLQITLNPDAVGAPAQNSAVLAGQIVAICLPAFEQHAASEVDHVSALGVQYPFAGPMMHPQLRRRVFDAWLLSRAFTEVIRGVRASLEEAALYVELAEWAPRVLKVGAVEAHVEAIRKRHGPESFPVLLAFVNSKLTTPLSFAAEFSSLQRIRNCLEHRAGIVGAMDVDSTGGMGLEFPQLKIFYLQADGTEVEVKAGTRVDPGDDREEVEVLGRMESFQKTYHLGERITLTAEEFHQITVSCQYFASDLISKLPKLPKP
jgi:hypothetical protein